MAGKSNTESRAAPISAAAVAWLNRLSERPISATTTGNVSVADCKKPTAIAGRVPTCER